MNMLRTLALGVVLSLLPVAQAETIFGMTTTSLFTFDSATPGTRTTIGTFAGGVVGHTMRGIDFRPSTGELYAVSSSSSTGQVYKVDTTTAALTAVGGTFALGSTSTRISLDFNPVVDRLRLVNGTGTNLRVNPDTGAITNDTALAYASGDTNFGTTPLTSGVAYSRNYAGAPTTTLYGYDYQTDSLVTVGTLNGIESPNSGQLHTVGQTFPLITSAASQGFDISGLTGTAYLQTDIGNSAEDFLYTLNLATGAGTQVGSFGIDVIDISAAPVPEPASMVVLGLGALAAARRRRNR